VAAAQNLEVQSHGGDVTAPADFTNAGTITLSGDDLSSLVVASGTLTNTGTINVVPALSPLTLRKIRGNLTNYGTVSIDFQPTSLGGTGATVVNAGQLELQDAAVSVEGAGFSNAAGGVLTSSGAVSFGVAPFTNAGTVNVMSGTLSLTSPLTNQSGGVLTGGTYIAAGALRLNTSAVITNAASIVLDGSASSITDLAGNGLLNGLTANSTGGSLTIQNGRSFTIPGDFANAGTMSASGGSTFTITGILNNTGTAAALNGGTLTVLGSYSQAAMGALTIGFAGAASGEFGIVNVSGAASLDGTLNITLVNGFGPAVGQQFQVMSYSGLTGDFAAINGLDVARVHLFEVMRNPTNVIVNSLVNAPDLAITSGAIQVPADGQPGQNVMISATVNNLAMQPANGSWFDSVYLSTDTILDPADALIGRIEHTGDVAGGASYSESLTAPLPAAVGVVYHVIVVVDSRGLLPDSARVNNQAASLGVIQVQVPVLTLGQPFSGAIAAGQDEYFQLTVPPSTDVSLKANFVVPGTADFYVRYDAAPDSGAFNFVAPNLFDLEQQISLSGTAGTYYILLHGRADAGSGAAFTLAAQAAVFEAHTVTPNRGSNLGQATITVSGSGFTTLSAVQLATAGGTVQSANQVTLRDSTTLFATFNLVGVSPGVYDVQVEDAGRRVTVPGAFTVTTGAMGEIAATISSPEAVRVGHSGTVSVDYFNSGETDVVAPLLVIEADTAVLDSPGPLALAAPSIGSSGGGGGTVVTTVVLPPPHVFHETALQILAISPDGPAGVLAPGAHGHLDFPFTPFVIAAHVVTTFIVSVPDDPDATFDWNNQFLKAMIKPPTMPDDAWDAVYANFVAMATATGSTLRSYINLLAANATYLSQLGEFQPEVARLFSFVMQQADDALPGQPLASATDAAAPAPGLPLVFSRTYLQPISRRYAMGLFGRGWSTNWDLTAAREPNGNVDVDTGTSLRTFIPLADGTFQAGPGDPGVLTAHGDGYSLREANGSVTFFGNDGKVTEISDRYGNTITAIYANGQLTRLVHSSGAAFTIHYNTQGHIDALTDQAGQVTTYSYDSSGEHLQSVTGPRGTTSYTYLTGLGRQREHALSTITAPDGTHVYLQYDPRGRFAGFSRDGNAEAVTIDYPAPGAMRTTDALGHSTTVFFNDLGQLSAVVDPLGHRIGYAYDADNHLAGVAFPDSLFIRTNFDSRGNLLSQLDPLGHAVHMTYDATFNQLIGIEDPLGNSTSYVRDGHGNVTDLVYPDGSAEHFSYDSRGLPTRSVNRRGQVLFYTYDDNGQLIRRDHGDGTHEDFAFDSRGNLISATDGSGTTSLEYDDASRLTRITYPSGRFIQYLYDAAGRRIQMIDQDGFTVNYSYDAAGRLHSQTDSTGAMIVAYTYDAAGETIRKDLGNGTFTTYSYDTAGNLLGLVNHAPDGSINSRFNYTYDELERRVSMTTVEGTTRYGYDATGQLTSVTLPDSGTISYAYDAAGNRISVTNLGVVTSYVTNNLNQYTGSTTNGVITDYQYDADGDLIQQTVAGQTNNYRYDDLGQLTQVSSPSGLCSFHYDPFGNLDRTSENGQTTEYLIDPTGLGNRSAEYDAAGGLVEHYVFSGALLTSRVDAAGGAAYYDFDAIGSTAGLTDTTGHYINQYAYLPFGEPLRASETVANPFTYVGQFGVTEGADGLQFMRERYYLPADGRFVTQDPIGIYGGLNFYRYAGNRPTDRIDPSGLADPVQLIRGSLGIIRQAVDNPASARALVGELGWTAEAEASATALNRTLDSPFPGALDPVDFVLPPLVAAPLSLSSDLREDLELSLCAASTNDPYLYLNPERYCQTAGQSDCMANPCLPRQRIKGALATFRVKPISGSQTQQIGSGDPNDMTGPAGFGDQHFVRADQSLVYRIDFENIPTATAAAQTVVVTQQLDPNLDFHTFEVGEFGIGDIIGRVPEGLSTVSARVDARRETGFFVDVTAGIDLTTGLVTWTFTTVDPLTFDLPSDPFPGFLPPNQMPPMGEAYVTYRIRPRPGVATGTPINSIATVVFDQNAPIDTPTVSDTIDGGPPTSSVQPLPATTTSTTFTVTWSGTDDAGGSGVKSFDVFVSDNGGAFTPLVTGTTQTSVSFTGQTGHTYGFYSVATDNVGHHEIAPTAAQATIQVMSADPFVAYVMSLYQIVLNRTPAGGEIAPWVHFLHTGGTRLQAAQTFWESPEHRGIEVDGYYQHYLHRPADAAGRSGWVHALLAGITELQVQEAFLASPEYQNAHPSNARLIDGLYADVLGRTETSGEQSGWLQFFERVGTPGQVAHLFLNSPENVRRVVDGYYSNLLHRPADSAGESGWWNALLNGGQSFGSVAESFLACDEFFARAIRNG
jgi:RHS repeat-associated protein